MSFHATMCQPEETPVWLTSNLFSSNNLDTVIDTCSLDPNHYFHPLSHVDNSRLNATFGNMDEPNPPVQLACDYTRTTATPSLSTLKSNYWDAPPKTLTKSTWFYLDPTSSKRPPQPLHPDDDFKVEEMYRTLNAKPIEGVGEGVELEKSYNGGKKYRAVLEEVLGAASQTQPLPTNPTSAASAPPPPPLLLAGKVYTLKLKPVGLKNTFSSTLQLQRGYGPYSYPGEAEESRLSSHGPPKEIIFVIHGIGELVWSKTEVTFVPSMIEQMNTLRIDIHKRQLKDYDDALKKHREEGGPEPALPQKIEILPIIWYQVWHTGTDIKKSLDSITIRTIPVVRTIANDIIFDVLMYQQKELRDKILKFVGEECRMLWSQYMMVNSGYEGDISICGHSLGSIIAWDLVTRLKEEGGKQGDFEGETRDQPRPTFKWGPGRSSMSEDSPSSGSNSLPAEPRNVWLMGSPVGLFLTVRDSHSSILSDPHFTLLNANTSLYNIFNPSDPVAYRIEPLQLPIGTPKSSIPPPCYVPTADPTFGSIDGVRAHLKAKEHMANASKKISEGVKIAEKLFGGFSKQIKSLGTNDESSEELERPSIESIDGDDAITFTLAGASNSRIDYQVQTSVLESELLSSITAHTSYFNNSDVIAMLTRK
ncbi:hypothetical protein TrVE_jg12697 [Triparma verrucosa]|uniref:DDHD domain-containing protein n=1 Tax=Triparma verrucosa TaxID=1606542 RepID=A0A9W7FEA7_9STRA|nr:hypothetical protein TrVE_jg12697 [Triparma verrucosa]